MPILNITPNRTTKAISPSPLLPTLALLGALWIAAPARAAETPANPNTPAPAAASATTPAKQWVWLWRQGVYGYGHQRADGLWVIDPGTKRLPAAPAAAAPVAAAPATVPAGDAYGFTNWLNATRASFGLGPVSVDPDLSNWAAANNAQQQSRGIGHFVMGPARRQNSAMGGAGSIGSMWMASPAHRAALLDPSIRWIGIAGLGAYWTFNAR